LKAFAGTESGQTFVYIPAVVLWEAAILERKGKIKLTGGFTRWAETLLANSGFGLAPLEPAIIDLAVGYNFNGDPFDGVITATASELSLPLITKDAAITKSNLVEIYW
jgi:PIN domain nuclease of toxin-antitoxin system